MRRRFIGWSVARMLAVWRLQMDVMLVVLFAFQNAPPPRTGEKGRPGSRRDDSSGAFLSQ